jgi:hypothetical protein
MPSGMPGVVILLLGFVWPLVVSIGGVIALAGFRPTWNAWDGVALLLLLLSLPGIAASIYGWYRSLPQHLPAVVRAFVAILIGVPVAGLSLYVAALLFGYGSLRLGYIG